MLELVFGIPLVGLLNILLIPREDLIKLKKTALEWSFLLLVVVVLLWGSLDEGGQFQEALRFE